MEEKTLNDHFRDWEASAFGFGYGSGEPEIIPAVKAFLDAIGKTDGQPYDYRRIEQSVTPVVAWLLINRFCQMDLIEYGSSPRFGWLTAQGVKLAEFFATHTADELVEIVTAEREGFGCSKDHCNCNAEVRCVNPFGL